MKKNMKWSEKYNLWLFLSCMIIGLIIAFTQGVKRYKNLVSNASLTTGVTIDFYYGGQTGRYIEYKYCVHGITFKDEQDYKNWEEVKRKGGNFLVMYSNNDPTNNMILFKYPVDEEFCLEITDKKLDKIKPTFFEFFWVTN